MKGPDVIFGRYLPTDSILHRINVGWKYLLAGAVTIPVFLLRIWWLSLIVVFGAAFLLLLTKIPARLTLNPGVGFTVMLAVVVGYQLLVNQFLLGIVLAANILTALYLSRLLTFTTPGPVLIDALVDLTKPLDRLGFSSEKFGLSIAIMVRSIPFLISSFSHVRDAARARGLDRNLFARVTPVVVSAVAYARRTGEALQARGLGDE